MNSGRDHSSCQPHGQNRCIIFQWKRKHTLRTESDDLSCLHSVVFAVRVCMYKCLCAGVSAQVCEPLWRRMVWAYVVNLYLMADKCDLLLFSLVWTCHQRLIAHFFKSFETVKQKRALFPVADQYITSTAGCIWEANYQRALLAYACCWLSNKPDASKPWVYTLRVFRIKTYIKIPTQNKTGTNGHGGLLYCKWNKKPFVFGRSPVGSLKHLFF